VSFLGWDRFDSGDLIAALGVHGIDYRRKGNIHGFDSVRLKVSSDG
jgi:hypothetical protein